MLPLHARHVRPQSHEDARFFFPLPCLRAFFYFCRVSRRVTPHRLDFFLVNGTPQQQHRFPIPRSNSIRSSYSVASTLLLCRPTLSSAHQQMINDHTGSRMATELPTTTTNGDGSKRGEGNFTVKTGLARMLKGGVIMDVVNAEQVSPVALRGAMKTAQRADPATRRE